MALYDQVMEAAATVQSRSGLKPAVGLILGSGLGDLATEVRDATAIPYGEIPHFLRSTVIGHAGRLLVGMLEDVPVVVMQGRFHFYEGYPLSVLTLPVRVMRMLGAHTLIVTNAAGGVNPAYRSGAFMLIRDHITLPVVVVARHMGMRVMGLSLITNSATGDETQAVNHAEVLTAADAARSKFVTLIRGIVRGMVNLTSS